MSTLSVPIRVEGVKALTIVAPKKAKELRRMLDAWINPAINRKTV